jgi:hypothetical protein
MGHGSGRMDRATSGGNLWKGKWGVVHFWQKRAFNAQSGTLRIPLAGSPMSDYYVSP